MFPRRRHRPRLCFPAWFAAALASVTPALGGRLEKITGFGPNPTSLEMNLYTPDQAPAHPPLLVGLHWCHGTASQFHANTGFARLADQFGFAVLYPNANSADSCWDVHSAGTLSHDGGGDALGIASMVRWTIHNRGIDSTRVFMTGISSGAMMTNVLAGSYPELFQAGAAFAGVPFSCFSGSATWNSSCATGKISKSGPAWGDAVRAAHPTYAGKRPRMQLWHGTDDQILSFTNFGEEIKQWTNVLGVAPDPTSTAKDSPRSGWIRTRYTAPDGSPLVEAIQETAQPHNLQILPDQAIAFFGLDQTSPIRPGGGIGPAGAHLSILGDPSSESVSFSLETTPGHVSLVVTLPDGSEASRRLDLDLETGSASGNLPLSNPQKHGWVGLVVATRDGRVVAKATVARP